MNMKNILFDTQSIDAQLLTGVKIAKFNLCALENWKVQCIGSKTISYHTVRIGILSMAFKSVLFVMAF